MGEAAGDAGRGAGSAVNVNEVEISTGPVTWGEYRRLLRADADGVAWIIVGRTGLTESAVDALDTQEAVALFKRVVEVIQREMNSQRFGQMLDALAPFPVPDVPLNYAPWGDSNDAKPQAAP